MANTSVEEIKKATIESNQYLSWIEALTRKFDPDFTKMSEEELVEYLRYNPDFENLVFPDSWYAKYKLPPKRCLTTKAYIKESPWMKTAQNYYISKEELPAKPGGLRPILPPPEVPALTVIENSFSDAPKPTNQICDGLPQATHAE